jgi:integrase
MPRAAPNIVRISKTTVDEAKPRAKRYFVWDQDLKGFGVHIAPSGVKTYVARYRAGGGRSGPIRRFTLGRHGTITAAQARGEADKILADATRNLDPQADRAKKRADITVAQLCDLYVAEGCATKKSSTLATDRSRIDGHIRPLLGAKRVQSITAADIERFQIDVKAGRSAAPPKPSRVALRASGLEAAALDAVATRRRGDRLPRGGRGAASRTMGLLGAIFAFAVRRSLRDGNPVRGIQRDRDRAKQRFLTIPELERLGLALAGALSASERPTIRPTKKGDHQRAAGARHGVAVIRLLFLTGARKSEIEGLRWAEIDAERSSLRLPDSKTGAKVIPIGPAALLVLGALAVRSPEAVPSAFVFPAEDDPKRHYVGTPRIWAKVKKMAALEGVRLHDARHTWASLAVSGGHSLPIIGAVLGHRDLRTTSQYAHLAASPVQVAVGVVEGSVADALAGRVPANGAAPT